MSNSAKAKEINSLLEGASAKEILQYFIKNFKDKMVFTSSLGAEDQAVTDIMCKIDKDVNIATLDTGRLFPETYKLIDETNAFYGIKMDVFFPNQKDVEDMVREKGINLFYNSIEDRKRCCRIRKIDSLERALEGMDVWITGLRREQSVTRTDLQAVEYDEAHDLIKVNPLIDWTEEGLWEYIRENNIPYNKLHDNEYPSIGCEPCTRQVKQGEDVRAGRWWWETPEQKECGLHVKSEKK
jgi:phosphoadenosine phosphosulfate reductase